MPKIIKFHVLNSSRLLLKYLNLYNKNNVHIGHVRVPDIFIFSLISLPTFYFIALIIWFCIDENFNLNAISISLAAAVGFIQITFVYIWLAVKKNLIISTIHHLQDVVENRNFFCNFRNTYHIYF